MNNLTTGVQSILESKGSELAGIKDYDANDIKRRLSNFIRDKEAYSENTWKQFLIVSNVWFGWCDNRNAAPFPLNPELIREWIFEMYHHGRAMNTIHNYVSILNMIHLQSGLPSIVSDQIVSLALKKVMRLRVGDGFVTQQAIPFNIDDLNTLDAVLAGSEEMIDIRNRAFMFTAYNTMLRISNLTSLRVRDLTFNDDGTVALQINKTKTTVDGEARIKTLSGRASHTLKIWLKKAELCGDENAFIFCGLYSGNQRPIYEYEKPLSNVSAIKIFQHAWTKLGREMPPKNNVRYGCWSGHSARIGAAQDMALKGVSLVNIMHEGMWTNSAIVMSYLRNLKSINSPLNPIVEDDEIKLKNLVLRDY